MDSPQDFSFRPGERMKLRKNIETLFQSGEAFSVFPLRIIHLRTSISKEGNQAALRIGISVPKKRLKRAVDRNLIKRRIREAWRLNKSSFLSKKDITPSVQIHAFIIYTSSDVLSYQQIQKAIMKVLERLHSIYNTKR